MLSPDLRELAWAAGLFEGEGSFGIKRSNPSGKNPYAYQYPVAQLAMTDEDAVRRFAAAVGVGAVSGPHAPRDRGRKPLFSWSVSGHGKVQHIACVLWFGLGSRRRSRLSQILLAQEGRIQ